MEGFYIEKYNDDLGKYPQEQYIIQDPLVVVFRWKLSHIPLPNPILTGTVCAHKLPSLQQPSAITRATREYH